MSGSSEHRLAEGGLIDRGRALRFTFDGTRFSGYAGDTLASALLGNGVRLMGRSFKYHRPRGPISAGSEEPNALVTLHEGARQDPNARATTTELFGGLVARSQNYRGSLRFDLLAANDRLAAFMTGGFYYKTFMWPAAAWETIYEPMIRKAAGLGRLSGRDDPDSYEKAFAHCDLLVIGAGPAGLMAALTAGRAGARVILADEDFVPGGRLNAERISLGDRTGAAWAAAAAAEIAGLPNVRLMTRTTVIGAYDGGIYGALQRVGEHLEDPPRDLPRQRLWKFMARRAILAAGALERPIAFADNDRPGIMMAGAARTWLNRFAVMPGRQVVVFTCHDDGWRTAADYVAAGAEVTAIVDSRPDATAPAGLAAAVKGIEVVAGGHVTGSRGRLGLGSLSIRDRSGRETRRPAQLLAVSGGWNPTLHLTCHLGGRPRYREDIAAFVPGGDLPAGLTVAGAAAGRLTTCRALADGRDLAVAALTGLGIAAGATQAPPRAEDDPIRIAPCWHVRGSRRAWIDQQNDVTTKDLTIARQEGFHAVEHLKRYTTLGMATDQGKTGNVIGLAVMAELTGKSIEETGTTVFRPPYTPVPIAAFAGRSRGREFRPVRLTPTHDWAVEQGAVFVEAGLWKRAQWFPQAGETHWRQSVDREVEAVRGRVGICDVTTLGKIDIQGGDAAAFLDRVYANTFSTVKIGRVRYGLMLREDGIVMDDGTTARLAENHYVMTTTTANAVPVFRHLEFCRQVLWPRLDVQLISTTEAWAQIAVAGPRSRAVLQKLVDPAFDISNAAFPYMACGAVTLCGGVPGRLFRLSFSGELAYEVAVPTRYGESLARVLMAAGGEFGIVAYGTEALGVMRVEKGHAAGNELNGTTTAADLGLGRMVSARKDCIGKVMSQRPGLADPDRPILVGFKPVDRSRNLAAGSHFIGLRSAVRGENDEGYMTSVAWSPTLGHSIGLGYIRRGKARVGERVHAVDLVHADTVEVEIASPHFLDPEGERLRA